MIATIGVVVSSIACEAALYRIRTQKDFLADTTIANLVEVKLTYGRRKRLFALCVFQFLPRRGIMPTCLPTPRIIWARDSSSFTWFGMRYLSISYWFTGRAVAERALNAAHPTTVAGVVAQVTAAAPNGCDANVTQAGPFNNIAHRGWWSGSGTLTRSTEVKGVYTCDTVPAGAIEYQPVEEGS